MTNACVQNQYFSGQGALLLAERDGSGNALGFRPVGNVSALTIGIETTVFEHKESCTGVRGIDLEIVQEVAASMTMTMESLDRKNLSLALYGTDSAIVGSSASDELVTMYDDLWMPLANLKVSAVIVGDDATPTVTYTEGADYELNAEAGTLKLISTGLITDAQVVFVDYTFADQDDIQALITGTAPQRWARFEGLNTADAEKPVTVDAFKLSVQPLAELALINEEITQMEIEATVLSDESRVTGSKYFSIRKVA